MCRRSLRDFLHACIPGKTRNACSTCADGSHVRRRLHGGAAPPAYEASKGPAHVVSQTGFTAMTCERCELAYVVFDRAMSEYRAAAKRGRAGRKPDRPERCDEELECSICCTWFVCGTRHGHPTDDEERENHRYTASFNEDILSSPVLQKAVELFGGPAVRTGPPEPSCEVCGAPTTYARDGRLGLLCVTCFLCRNWGRSRRKT